MVTIKEIAQKAGISPSTVSIVLGGKAAQRKISSKTQKRIFDIAHPDIKILEDKIKILKQN